MPASPLSVSLPTPPVMVSLPVPPAMLTLEVVLATKMSLPAEPVKVVAVVPAVPSYVGWVERLVKVIALALMMSAVTTPGVKRLAPVTTSVSAV